MGRSKALALRPQNPSYHSNLGIAYQALGRPQEADACFREALRLKPHYAEVHNNLGIALRDQGRPAEAETCFREALRLQPDYPEAHSNLGAVLREGGRREEAEACFREALRLRPNYPEAHANLDRLLRDRGPSGELEAGYRAALRLRPNQPAAHNNLGALLQQQRKLQEAEACFREALRLKPDFPEAHNNLGNALRDQGRLQEAEVCYREALRLKPDFPEAHNNLGNVLRDRRRLQEAEACYREALRLKPGYAEAHNNLGNAVKDLGRLQEAKACYGEALRLKPGHAGAQANLGNVLRDQGRLPEAEACYREALRLQPDYVAAHSNLLFCLNCVPALSPTALLAEHRAWAARHAPASAVSFAHGNDRSPGRRLRVGYVSPDLRRHPVACFLEPVLAHHDPRQVEVCCFAEVAAPDATTHRLRSLAHVWHSTCGLSDEQLAARIYAQGIDILVDLAGHTANNRLRVFARRPAPVQVTYLGYPNTTGLAAIDYRLTDAVTDPPGDTERYHTEQLVRLPGCFLCYLPTDSPPVAPLPAIRHGQITFGSFNNLAKVTPEVLRVWTEVLAAVRGSRLLLLAKAPADQATRERLGAIFSHQGIDPGRLDLRGWERSTVKHLTRYQEMDIALDTFPYNGQTTTCEALWMGVPIITLAGAAHVARVGKSLLCCLELQELVADNPEQYVAIARRLAEDRAQLQELRGGLRERMRRSPLLDAQRFTGNLESAYRRMWEKWVGQAGSSASSGPH